MAEPLVRPTTRVLLLDENDHLLLFRSTNDDGVSFWYPVGGGVESGESAEEGAVREVLEETGVSNLKLGPEVWYRRHVFVWRGVKYDLRERWFIARVRHFDLDTSGFTDEERDAVLEYRWWTLDDLRGATELLVPADLAERLGELLTYGPPSTPVEVGI